MQVLRVPVIAIPVFRKPNSHWVTVTCILKAFPFQTNPSKKIPLQKLFVVWYVLGGVGQCIVLIYLEYEYSITFIFIWFLSESARGMCHNGVSHYRYSRRTFRLKIYIFVVWMQQNIYQTPFPKEVQTPFF